MRYLKAGGGEMRRGFMMINRGELNWSTHQARYIIDTMNMRSTKAPAATPYTHIFSFPSVEEEARQFVCLHFNSPTTAIQSCNSSFCENFYTFLLLYSVILLYESGAS